MPTLMFTLCWENAIGWRTKTLDQYLVMWTWKNAHNTIPIQSVFCITNDGFTDVLNTAMVCQKGKWKIIFPKHMKVRFLSIHGFVNLWLSQRMLNHILHSILFYSSLSTQKFLSNPYLYFYLVWLLTHSSRC